MFGLKNDSDRDTGIETRVETYDDQKALQRGINQMASRGWTFTGQVTPIRTSALSKKPASGPFAVRSRLLATFTRPRRR